MWENLKVEDKPGCCIQDELQRANGTCRQTSKNGVAEVKARAWTKILRWLRGEVVNIDGDDVDWRWNMRRNISLVLVCIKLRVLSRLSTDRCRSDTHRSVPPTGFTIS